MSDTGEPGWALPAGGATARRTGPTRKEISVLERDRLPGRANKQVTIFCDFDREHRPRHVNDVKQLPGREIPNPDLPVLPAGEGERPVHEMLARDSRHRPVMLAGQRLRRRSVLHRDDPVLAAGHPRQRPADQDKSRRRFRPADHQSVTDSARLHPLTGFQVKNQCPAAKGDQRDRVTCSHAASRVIRRNTNRRHIIGDHHGRSAGQATHLVRAADGILGTQRQPRQDDQKTDVRPRQPRPAPQTPPARRLTPLPQLSQSHRNLTIDIHSRGRRSRVGGKSRRSPAGAPRQKKR